MATSGVEVKAKVLVMDVQEREHHAAEALGNKEGRKALRLLENQARLAGDRLGLHHLQSHLPPLPHLHPPPLLDRTLPLGCESVALRILICILRL